MCDQSTPISEKCPYGSSSLVSDGYDICSGMALIIP